MKKGSLAVLAGIDGAGKSTVLLRLENDGFFTSHWRKLEKLPQVKNLNFKNPAEVVQTLEGEKRLKFIWSYINLEQKYLIAPTLEAGRNVVSDSFFVKFFVKEQIYKRLNLKEFSKRNPFVGDELFIMIDVPPEIAFQRKTVSKISPYECFRTPQDFIEFQTLQRQNLLTFIKKFPHTILDGTLPENDLIKKVKTILFKNQMRPT
jgi:thymidylate kinase